MADKKTGGAGTSPPGATEDKSRKPWIKKSPVEIFLNQIAKQEKRVAELEGELAKEKRELEKMQAAKKVLEGK